MTRMPHVIVASPHKLHRLADRLRHTRCLNCRLVVDPPSERAARSDYVQGHVVRLEAYGVGDGGLCAGRRLGRHPDLCRPGLDIGHRATDLHRGVVDECERKGRIHPLGQRRRRRHRWDRCRESTLDIRVGDAVNRAGAPGHLNRRSCLQRLVEGFRAYRDPARQLGDGYDAGQLESSRCVVGLDLGFERRRSDHDCR